MQVHQNPVYVHIYAMFEQFHQKLNVLFLKTWMIRLVLMMNMQKGINASVKSTFNQTLGNEYYIKGW